MAPEKNENVRETFYLYVSLQNLSNSGYLH